MALRSDTSIRGVEVLAYTVPTEGPESDGTLEWDRTTAIVVRIAAGGEQGLGYSYGPAAAAGLVADKLASLVVDADALRGRAVRSELIGAVRNDGRPGVASIAIAAVDNALWDLRARIMDVSLAILLGPVRDEVTVYGSGGFTSYSISELERQFESWASSGIESFKMKIGRSHSEDPGRIRAARRAVGEDATLMVDANGAYDRKKALETASALAAWRVGWFEEPVSSDDLEGLRLVRDRAPAGMEIAAGEYGFDTAYFNRMLSAGAVDAVQVDATRCAGITGFLDAGAVAEAHHVPLSAHTAPHLHAHVCCVLPGARHVEYFHDHVRVERLLFDGVLEVRNGALEPDRSRPGIGLDLKTADAAPYLQFRSVKGKMP